MSEHELPSLTGQVALVTGAGRGLGRAFALALAQAGAAVAVTARTPSELDDCVAAIEAGGGRAVAVPANVADGGAVRQMLKTVEAQLGAVDLLVNNAGSFRAFGNIVDIDPELWWREMEVNVRGPFLCSRAVLPAMIDRGRGRLINLVSVAALQAFPGISAYCMSKAAIVRLTDTLALEVQNQGISVFAVHPGMVKTPMLDYTMESEEVARSAPHIQEAFRAACAAGQDTPVERPVRMLLQLAAGLGDPLSGRYISVDDDLALLVREARLAANGERSA